MNELQQIKEEVLENCCLRQLKKFFKNTDAGKQNIKKGELAHYLCVVVYRQYID